jgi:small-conductance mechanosensitive channel
VEGIEIIYTKMRTLDDVVVAIPNQELLKTEIENFGRKKAVRRHVAVTPGYEYDSKDVERALVEAADQVHGVLKEPKPYVWITRFLDYAVEYTLFVYVKDIERIPQIDADLYRTVLDTVKKPSYRYPDAPPPATSTQPAKFSLALESDIELDLELSLTPGKASRVGTRATGI